MDQERLTFEYLPPAAAVPYALLELEQTNVQEPWKKNTFARIRSNLKTRTRLAKVDGELVGYMIYTHEDDHIHLDKIVVAEEYRHYGIARKMIEDAKSLLKESKPRFTCVVPRTNESFLEALQRWGFEADETDPGSGKYHIAMVHTLEKSIDETEVALPSEQEIRAVERQRQQRQKAVMLSRMRHHLSEITGMEWKFVKPTFQKEWIGPDDHALLPKTSARWVDSSAEEASRGELGRAVHLQTINPVRHPKPAIEALEAFFENRFPERPQEFPARPIEIPTRWIFSHQLEKNFEGGEKKLFRPSPQGPKQSGP